MTTRKRPRLRRALERALLARDRVEIAAAERLLALLKVDARKPRRRVRAR
jgi:hypothetical protein